MAEPKLLLTDEEYAEIKIRAAREKKTPQKFMRDAVRAALDIPNHPTATPTDSALQTAKTLVQHLDTLEAKSRNLAREVENAAIYLKGIIDATVVTDAGSAARGEPMEAELLRSVAPIVERARGAAVDAVEDRSGAKSADSRTTGARGVKSRRRTS